MSQQNENKQQVNNNKIIQESFSNFQVFHSIATYLRPKNVLKLMQLNKEIYRLVQDYFKTLLRKEGYITFQSQQIQDELEKNLNLQNQEDQIDLLAYKSVTQDGFNDVIQYHLLYKYFHNRNILYTSLQNSIVTDNVGALKVYRARHFQELTGQSMKDFQVGKKFTSFLTKEKTLFICKTQDFFELIDPQFEIRKNVKQFSNKCRNFMYLTEQGTVSLILYDSETPMNDLKEIILPFSISCPVESMHIQYMFSMFKLQESSENQRQKNSSILESLVTGDFVDTNDDQNKTLDDTKQNFLIYYNQNVNQDNYQDPLRFKRIVDYPYSDNCLDFIVGFNHAYILSHKNEVFEADLGHYLNQGGMEQGHLKMIENSFLKNKHIVMLKSGLYSYIAVEREEIQSIDNWDCEQVQEFIDKIGLEDYSKIVKYENIDGKILKKITKNFMIKTMGLIKEDLQTKLQTEIAKYTQISHKGQKLYGWGKNESGQLGLIPCNMVHKPTQIQLPNLLEGDVIKDVQIGWKNSMILTEFNKFYVTDQRPRDKKNNDKSEQKQDISISSNNNKDIQQQNNNYEENSNDFRGKNNSKTGKKHRKDKKQHNNSNDTSNSSNLDFKISKKQSSKEEKNQEFSEKNSQDPNYRWLNITNKFTILGDKRKYRIQELSNSQYYISVLAAEYDENTLKSLKNLSKNNQCIHVQNASDLNILQKTNQERILEEKSKMQITQNNYQYNDQDEVYQKQKVTKTDEVINRIKWDENFDENDFRIIYEDRFLGDLEVPFSEFMCSEAKVHRVKVFKLKGEVVWDKEKRIDKIQDM